MRKLLFVVALLMLLPLAQVGADEDTDLLLITISDVNSKPLALMLYDPATQKSTHLLENVVFHSATLSVDGRLAFSADAKDSIDLFLLDTHDPNQEATPITNSADSSEIPQMWSPDGNYLAFMSKSNANPDHSRLYVWDGATTLELAPQEIMDIAVSYYALQWSPDGRYLAFQITDDKGDQWLYVWDGDSQESYNITLPLIEEVPQISYYYTEWSMDGRLAITILYRYDLPPSEIYLWDGRYTTNLSQNPAGADSSPIWSADGQLAFQSLRNDKRDILMWDGVSYRFGVPDATAFINVSSKMSYSAYPGWTSQNQLAFVGKATNDTHTQIYIWDGQRAVNISQNPTEDTGIPVWMRNGRWAYTGYFSSKSFLYVRDADNQLLLKTNASNYSKLVWSLSGDLMYCVWDESGWTLGVWDGKAVGKAAHGANVYARWQSGGSIFCTSG